MRLTPAEKEIARHQVDLLLLNESGDVVESHRMQSWDVSLRVGGLVAAFRSAHGYAPLLHCRFLDRRDGSYLLPGGGVLKLGR